MTATWRKQPPIPSRLNQNVRNQPTFTREHTCRRCRTEIPDTMKYCWEHYAQLSDIEKDNLRRMR